MRLTEDVQPDPAVAELQRQPGRIVAILGMHRSGTSCLAGCLEEAGLGMGEVVQVAPHNRKGNRENLIVRELNDDVLTYSEAAWNQPPSELRWHTGHTKRRDAILHLHSSFGQWGFKDPRTTLTLPFWTQGLPQIQLVGTFRHPMAVARSLEKRDGISISEGLRLWRAYNERLLEYHRDKQFPIVSFDLPYDAYRLAVRAMIKRLGLEVGDEGPHFVQSSLVHQHGVGDNDLGPDIVEIYRELQAATL